MKKDQAFNSFVAGWTEAMSHMKAQDYHITACVNRAHEHVEKLPKRKRKYFKKP